MWAVVLHGYGGPEELKWEQVEDPKPGEGEVLVRTAAASVNPIDWKMRNGAVKERFPVEFPGILGRDVSGVVRAVGPGVEGFEAGDRVMALSEKTYAELVVVKVSDLARVPDDLDLVEAASLPLVCMTGEQLITLGTGVAKGQTVLITGALGSVGRVAVFTAKRIGAKVIAGVRGKQRKEAEALQVDAVVAIDSKDEIGRLGFVDAIADTVNGETAQTLIEKVKQGGVFASVAGMPANAKLHPTVRVVPLVAKHDAKALEDLAREAAAKRLVIPVDRMMPMAEAGAAQAAAEKGGVGKILLLA